MDIKSRDEFLSAAMAIMTKRNDCNVMVIVDGGEGGLEVLQTQQSFIWTFGLLAATEKMLDERYRNLMASEEAKRREAQMNSELHEAIQPTGGKAN